MEPKKRLGRGLDALLGAYRAEPEEARPRRRRAGRRTVPIALIERNPRNPRRDFPPEELDELAASIRQHGIVQPIVVRPLPGDDGALRDHRRRAALAGGAARRAARGAGRRPRRVRPRGARARDRGERAARRPQPGRGGARLSGADRGVRLQAGRSRHDDRQEPRACRQHAAAAEAAEVGAHHDAGRARSPPGTGGRCLARAIRSGWRKQVVEKNLSVRETERLAQAPDEEPPRARPKRKAVEERRTRVALEKELADRLGMKVEVEGPGEGRRAGAARASTGASSSSRRSAGSCGSVSRTRALDERRERRPRYDRAAERVLHLSQQGMLGGEAPRCAPLLRGTRGEAEPALCVAARRRRRACRAVCVQRFGDRRRSRGSAAGASLGSLAPCGGGPPRARRRGQRLIAAVTAVAGGTEDRRAGALDGGRGARAGVDAGAQALQLNEWRSACAPRPAAEPPSARSRSSPRLERLAVAEQGGVDELVDFALRPFADDRLDIGERHRPAPADIEEELFELAARSPAGRRRGWPPEARARPAR